MGMKGEILKHLKVETVTSDGKSLARNNGQVIFIKEAVPGDVVDVKIFKRKRSFLEGIPVKYHTYSDKRTEPFCSHFGSCGGCKWQHMDYASQLEYKQQQVVDQFERIGKIKIPPVNPIIPSDKIKLYRNKLEFTFTNQRWLSREEIGSGQELNRNGLGFHMPGRFDRVIDIENCHLMPEPSNELRLFIKFFAINNNLSFYDVKRNSGLLRTLVIRVANSGEIMVMFQFGEDNRSQIKLVLEEIKNSFPEITSLNYVINTKGNDSYYDLHVINFSGTSYITEKLGDLIFRIGPKSFFQTNTLQSVKLYQKVREYAQFSGKEVVYDLYSGIGTIACFLANNAIKVIGLEYMDEAVKDAKINSEINGIMNTEFISGDIKDILSQDFYTNYGRPDVIITDPPRSGMHPDVVKAIVQSGASKIIYISCNPATQARDIRLMLSDYAITGIQPVDMFPHTHHLENIARLERIHKEQTIYA